MRNLILIILSIFILENTHAQSTKNETAVRHTEYMVAKKREIALVNRLEPEFQMRQSQKMAFEIADALYNIKKYEKALMYYETGMTFGDADERHFKNYFNALYEFNDMEIARRTANDYYIKFGKKDLINKMDTADAMRANDPVYFEYNINQNTDNNEYGLITLEGAYKFMNTDNNFKGRYNFGRNTPHPFIIKHSDTGKPNSRFIALGEKTDKYYDVISHYDPKTNVVYITRGTTGPDGYTNLKIFSSAIDEDFNLLGEYTPFKYNNENYSVGHPTVTKDGDMMYFASDNPEGKGGIDIYRCEKLEDGSWGSPINVGSPVNTEGDELYPFISPMGNTLYFSSTYHSIMGGLDINKAEKTRFHTFKNVTNMGMPFNSSKDDYGLFFNDNYGTEGFFNSNREEGFGGDDVYNFSYHNNKVCKDPIKNFMITVLDKKTREKISNVSLKMTVKADGKVYSAVTDENGEIHLTVEGCNDFDVEATHDFYLNNEFYYDGFRKQVTIELDKKELNNIVELESIYYEKAKFELPARSLEQMAKLSKLLRKNTDVVVELGSHTDARGDDKFNLTLSQKRADAITKYLISEGINKSQLVPVGYGESKILNECGNDIPCDEDKHEKNRRTEFKILEIRKK